MIIKAIGCKPLLNQTGLKQTTATTNETTPTFQGSKNESRYPNKRRCQNPIVLSSLALLTLGVPSHAYAQKESTPKEKITQLGSATITQGETSIKIDLNPKFESDAIDYIEKDSTDSEEEGQLLIQGTPRVSKNKDGGRTIEGNGLVINAIGKGKYNIVGNKNTILAESIDKDSPSIRITGNKNIYSGDGKVLVEGNENRVQSNKIKVIGDFNTLIGTDKNDTVISNGNNTVKTGLSKGNDIICMPKGGRYYVDELPEGEDIRQKTLYATGENIEYEFSDEVPDEKIENYIEEIENPINDEDDKLYIQPPGNTLVLIVNESEMPKIK